MEQGIEFVQPVGLGFQFFLLRERSFHIDLRSFKLLFKVVQLHFVHLQTLWKPLQRIIQAGDITKGVRAEGYGIEYPFPKGSFSGVTREPSALV